MKAVIDTNVFISSFFGGNPRRVIDRWKNGELIICLSPAIMEEYTAVLKKLGLDGQPELEEILGLFAKGYNCIFTSKLPALDIVKEDPADNKFFECAVALKAGKIVSGDKHVLQVGNYMGIETVTPRELLDG